MERRVEEAEVQATRQKDPPSLLARQFSSMQDAMKAQYIFFVALYACCVIPVPDW